MLRHKKQRTFNRHDKQSPLKLKDVSIQSKSISCWSAPELLERNERVFCSWVENNLLKQKKQKNWEIYEWAISDSWITRTCFVFLKIRISNLYSYLDSWNSTSFVNFAMPLFFWARRDLGQNCKHLSLLTLFIRGKLGTRKIYYRNKISKKQCSFRFSSGK